MNQRLFDDTGSSVVVEWRKVEVFCLLLLRTSHGNLSIYSILPLLPLSFIHSIMHSSIYFLIL